MPQVGVRLTRAMTQFLASAEQTLSDRFDIHLAHPVVAVRIADSR
jgi:hypothetical protein